MIKDKIKGLMRTFGYL